MSKKQKEKKSKHYKHPTYGMVFADADIVCPVGYLCWPYLVTARPGMKNKDGTEGQPRFEATILLKKDSEKTEAFLKQVETKANEMLELFNEGRSAKISGLTFVKDGDTVDLEEYPYLEHYPGNWILVARNAQRPDLIDVNADEKGNPIKLDPTKFLAGHRVRASLQLLITAHGLSYKLKALQYVRDDGTRFTRAGASSKNLVADKDGIEDELGSDIVRSNDTEDVSLQEAADSL